MKEAHKLKAASMMVICGECGARMILRDSAYGRFWGCSNYPHCRGTHGAHPDGRPLGTPANEETKLARQRLHALMETKWRYRSMKQRVQMYKWLEENAPQPHIAMMSLDEVKQTEDEFYRQFGGTHAP